jgi:MFS family permease
MRDHQKPHLRFNLIINILDGGFFGAALGFASFSTILPLFVRQMTDSAVLLGLVPALHSVGWNLPQIFTASWTARLRWLKPTVLFLSIQERLPFLGLAAVAWFFPVLGPKVSLVLTFTLLAWEGLGAGLTANGWQNLISRIIPGETLGTFFGLQSAAANLLSSLAAITAGFILVKFSFPTDFTFCFLLAAVGMGISWFFLSLTRETGQEKPVSSAIVTSTWAQAREILANDRSFRWFLITRALTPFALMASVFYSVYAVEQLRMSESTVGILTSVMLVTQVAANPVLGRLADRWSYRGVMEIGVLAAAVGSLLAWRAPSAGWFYPVVVFTGLAYTTYWTVGLAFMLRTGNEAQRPTYIGMANTLIAPFAIGAPLLGGWLADISGYKTTFFVAALLSVLTTVVFHFFVKDPHEICDPPGLEVVQSL